MKAELIRATTYALAIKDCIDIIKEEIADKDSQKQIEQEDLETQPNKKKLNCDQVNWIMNALQRVQLGGTLQKSRTKESAVFTGLLEIMEILGYEFEDDKAAGNALSQFHEFNKVRGF